MKFYIETFGCKVNTYEAEVMSDLLSNHGYILGKRENVDISIINSCCVTNVAETKTFRAIRQALKHSKLVIVVGCLSQIKMEEIKKLGVHIVLGNKDKSKIIKYIEEYQNEQISKIYDLSNVPFEDMQLNNLKRTRAFVKIQDGCENFCSYCIIPYTRGHLRSKAKDKIVEEIKNLVSNGYKEIVLTGIHTGNYGHDLGINLANLINDILKIADLKRLRISSIEITEITDELLDIIRNSEILVDHMHIPLQAGSNKTLKNMNRKYDINYFVNKIKELRAIRPNIAITTDVIVGFPGETEEDFNETIITIKTVKFSKLHVFPYSKKDGTVAALMNNQVNDLVKTERVKILLALSKKLEMNYINDQINKNVTFLPEVYRDGYLIGHTDNYLLVKAKGNRNLLNKLVDVKIDKIDYPYSLSTIIDAILTK